jgi:hypothetical protein
VQDGSTFENKKKNIIYPISRLKKKKNHIILSIAARKKFGKSLTPWRPAGAAAPPSKQEQESF